jgi:hypothetical protein
VSPLTKILLSGQALVAHACNPSHSGSRDQKVWGSKLAWANSSRDPILKNKNKKHKKVYEKELRNFLQLL